MTVADIIGLIGSAIFIVTYAYATFSKAMDKIIFNSANLIGSVLVLYSLSARFNLAATVLEVAWAAIAILGLFFALLAKARKTP